MNKFNYVLTGIILIVFLQPAQAQAQAQAQSRNYQAELTSAIIADNYEFIYECKNSVQVQSGSTCLAYDDNTGVASGSKAIKVIKNYASRNGLTYQEKYIPDTGLKIILLGNVVYITIHTNYIESNETHPEAFFVSNV